MTSSRTTAAGGAEGAGAHYRSALQAWRDGDAASASAHCRAALQIDPHHADAWLLLGGIEHRAGNTDAALTAFDRAVTHSGGHPAARANRAAARLRAGDTAGARADAGAATQVAPSLFGGWLNLGLAAAAERDVDAAIVALSKAVALRADDQTALFGLARAQQDGGRMSEGIATLERLLAVAPDHAQARLHLANALANDGQYEASLAQYRELLRRRPDAAQAHSTYLIALQYDPDVSPERLLEEHRAWAVRHAPAAELRKARPLRGRRLRVGWVSPRFANGPVATFFLAVLRAFDRTRIEHVLYPTYRHADAAARAFADAAEHWRPAWTGDDDAFVEQVRGDAVDVLVDLSGHAPAHRLRAFARRAAPLQVSWLDYFCTTGIPAMDVLLSDDDHTPRELEGTFCERIVRLPSGRLCYAPPDDAPPLDPLPRDGAGPVLCSFNRVLKLNAHTLALWGRILDRLPEAQLWLRGSAFAGATDADRWRGRLHAAGIDVERVRMLPFTTYRALLDDYRRVDVALDPFLFSGCATTADALWMGVPVVTRIGRTMVSRQSAALLRRVGLQPYVAEDDDGYVEAAVQGATASRDIDRRRALRQAMLSAHDPRRFAGELEEVLLRLYRERAGHD